MIRKYSTKICGNVFPEDALMVASHGPDYMGWIFSHLSPRRIDLDLASRMIFRIRSEHPEIKHTALFAANSVPEIMKTIDFVKPDLIQITDGSGLIDSLRLALRFWKSRSLPAIVPALRIKENTDDRDLVRYGEAPFFILDSHVPGKAGGSGVRFDTALVSSVSRPFLLAGGLTCENVIEALSGCRASGADVSSGVEIKGRPGRKDPERVAEFIRLVRAHSQPE